MKIRWLYFVLISSLLCQCAKQTSPTGGPTDETPPALERSNPKHEQTNVKSSKIELTFNEAIQLNNAREQIIITPSVGKKFETTFNKRSVTLDLKADLQENTTYNINFREAIQDITEKKSGYR
jgi:methionine-rich copper-binding protein CopC